MKGTVVITGGGTGGHLKVAKAFVDEFHKRGISAIFIGSTTGQDEQWFKNERKVKKAFFLNTKGVVDKNLIGKLKAILQIVKEINHCLNIFDKAEVKTVISVGGFSAAPATFASVLSLGCKLYIHEQNSKMGKLNEITSRFATEVFSSYIEDSKIKDYPVSSEFFDNARVRHEIETIIFLGGSQGARAINDFALSVALKLDELGIKIIHQTGKADFQRVKNKYDELNLDVDVFDFTDDISKKMSLADFAISRSGASTLWELAANSLPTLFVPYPYAAKDHQYYNAKFLKDKKLCFVCRERNLKPEIIDKILKADIKSMSKGLIDSIGYNAIESIVDVIIENNQK
ncbi:UDP-N-acetylglucosamine--N-acetylmuramyl-(pentapeptide) pyrophosphoryl-undecaprenol N-acetylglucosamine transferase [Malaciobacter marinus]|jgi:UDP-N-acetylglucosamine--N-acetylmuramyl-(pentapeptide) pyrophosphoryl-undecaprenol N-acetylglucosamine transferase|uniref:UDP-N-acetylglucosamine--N-acetylmuramyl- (pentapeptide) pyrophosphoryl-undecaprenol N-acetylglucosamine transferase n=1 Tax=Malaciobacter TaxID=2321114 RepID=UPI0009A89A65|nr:UDP-N-acetylglucosamine--N-acetylmuramyl-(pentapeptide) pyrophosphoryl-undecaprenol N-acetylglucosamine transferase [Malaciobacter marinus]SKB24680.1 UDP-N-acetylglucosamine-N-acetylmuramylpentapeptide N-acetylglucosamine transferase [Malaciobacter marinus]